MLLSEIKKIHQWHKENPHILKQYRGQWIAFTADGIIAHHQDYLIMKSQIDPAITEFIIDRIHEYEFTEKLKFYALRFRNFKKHEWTPKYPVLIDSKPLEMVVDSGADMSLINYQVGLDLGFTKSVGELGEAATGVGGEVTYLIRTVEMSIEGKTFNARLAWLQSDLATDNLLGRETVFDMFDIEFKQADEEIIFRSRELAPEKQEK
jgi:hypothetical protein